MKRFDMRIVLAVLLILGGIIFLLQNVGVIGPLQGYLFALLFALGGLAFLGVLATDRAQWWAAIPGGVLLDLGLIIALGEANSRGALRFPEDWIGGIFLLGIGLTFFLVFFLRPEFWWAIIPAGVLSSLGLTAGFSSSLPFDSGALLFLGMGLTFALLGLLPVNNKRMTWPWIPAAVLIVLGLVVLSSSLNWFQYIWPVVLILAGGFLLLRGFARQP